MSGQDHNGNRAWRQVGLPWVQR